MHFHSFHQESVMSLLLCASLTSRVPRRVRPPEFDLGTYCLLHLCGLSGLQEHQDGAGSTRPHLFQSRAGYNAQARQTAPGNRFGIQLATYIPPHFAFLISKGDPGKVNGAGSTCPHRFPGAACPTPAHINVPGQQRRQRPT